MKRLIHWYIIKLIHGTEDTQYRELVVYGIPEGTSTLFTIYFFLLRFTFYHLLFYLLLHAILRFTIYHLLFTTYFLTSYHLNFTIYHFQSTFIVSPAKHSGLCRLRSIAAHRDHFVRRLSVCACVCLSGSHTFLIVTLVNTIETKPLHISLSNLQDMLTVMRGFTLLIL